MIDEAREKEKFEKWFLQKDPEPFDEGLNLSSSFIKKHNEWSIRYSSAKVSWLECARETGRQAGEEERERLRLENQTLRDAYAILWKASEVFREAIKDLEETTNGKGD